MKIMIEAFGTTNNPEDDCFKPPKKSRLVECLHCGRIYQSSEMVYEKRFGEMNSFWYCVNPKCTGAGYGFDIHDKRKTTNTK